MQAAEPTSAVPSAVLVRALRRVLRPLVRVMVAQGVTFPFVAEMLKGVFVEVAHKEFGLGEKPPTDSRISLVTGVHRKDVSRLRGEMLSQDEVVPEVVSLGAQLVAVWMGTPRFLDADGQPLPLPRFASEGGELSFEALVAGVNSDIRSRVVLDEWLRLGVAHLDEERRVCLNAAAFVPSEGFDEKAFYLGHNLHDHAAAVAHNLLGAPSPFLERSVQYDALGPDEVARLAQQSRDLGMKALLAVNESALAATHVPHGNASLQRMTFGIYFYSEPAPAAADTKAITP